MRLPPHLLSVQERASPRPHTQRLMQTNRREKADETKAKLQTSRLLTTLFVCVFVCILHSGGQKWVGARWVEESAAGSDVCVLRMAGDF